MIRKLFFYIAIAILASCTVAKKKVAHSQFSMECQDKSTLPGNTLDSVLKEKCKIRMKPQKNFYLKKEIPTKGNMIQYEFANSTDFITIKCLSNMDDSAAINFLRDKQFLIDNLFKVQPSPYPDQVSNAINCPDSLRPVTYSQGDNGNWIFAYRLFANNRFVYGECSGESNYYISAYIFCYIAKHKILNEIKLFTPLSESTENVDKLINTICIISD